jgi:CBS domain-containing protein
MTLHEILQAKGTEIHSIGPDATLDEVIRELVRYNIGSLIVCESAARGTDIRMIGIITERDVMRKQDACPAPLPQIRVADTMTHHLITAEPDDRIEHAMRLMTQHRIRHLPVLQQGQLCGVISIGDIVKAHHDQLEMENHFMTSYIRGEGGELATPPSID